LAVDVPEPNVRIVFLLPLLASLLPAQSPSVLAALANGSYFPLDVGDRWVYWIDDRFVTGAYQTWRIDRQAIQNGTTYSVMAMEGPGTLYAEYWFRADTAGRVYILSGTTERLFLDPTAQSSAGTDLVAGQRGPATSVLGTFPDTLAYRNQMGQLLETGTLARGIGLLSSLTILQAGSSGGLTQGRKLVEASLAGGIHFSPPAPSLQLGIESLALNVSAKQVANCAIPCYFAACTFVGGVDPPNTYKPCAQARIELANWPSGQSRAVRLQLVASDATIAYDQTVTLDNAPGESVALVHLPLYSAPNQPLPSGSYQLTAKTSDGAAESSLSVRIN
jgi:hypothetical protein